MVRPFRVPIGWDFYMPGEEYTPTHVLASTVKELTEWFRGDGAPLLHGVEYVSKHRVEMEWDQLRLNGVEGFQWAVENKPQEALSAIGIAAFSALFSQRNGVQDEDMVPPPRRRITPRILNYKPVLPMKYLKSNRIGKFVTLTGTVVRVSTIRPMLLSVKFFCQKCNAETEQLATDGKFEQPTGCRECGSKNIIPDRSASVTTDWQKIRVQEMQTDETREEGKMPRTVECELADDLVDSCIPGDEVTVSGIVKVLSTDGGTGAGSKNKCLFLLYIDVNSLTVAQSKDTQDKAEKADAGHFSAKDLAAVRAIAEEPDPLHLIVNSICPSIYGHETVKMALALALFGGCAKLDDDRSKMPVRGDSHVLVVGDPGLGKSQMLKAVSNLAPRGVYVCGNTTSSAGLTVTVVKDAVSGDFMLEAGALVLADQGVCCIDEFDKMMNGEQQALLEAMEQQSISIAKAGIVCSLSARAAVIAAANPVGGHYNRAKTVCENLKMSPAIMSRFDVVFILLDSPDEDRDHLLSEHVMARHRGASAHATLSATRSHAVAHGAAPSLSQRLQLDPGAAFDPLPHEILRKYIVYCRKFCRPAFDPAAKLILQDFYTEQRRRAHGSDGMPVTMRQLEALMRLAQARAKLELSEVITAEHAREVVALMKESLVDTLTDEFGAIDGGRASGMSKSKETKRFIRILHREAERDGNNVFQVSELKQIAAANGIQRADELIETLNNNQVLLMKGGRKFQLQTVSQF